MSAKNDIVRLKHILEAAKDALSFVQDKTRSSLDTDKMLERVQVCNLNPEIRMKHYRQIKETAIETLCHQ